MVHIQFWPEMSWFSTKPTHQLHAAITDIIKGQINRMKLCDLLIQELFPLWCKKMRKFFIILHFVCNWHIEFKGNGDQLLKH